MHGEEVSRGKCALALEKDTTNAFSLLYHQQRQEMSEEERIQKEFVEAQKLASVTKAEQEEERKVLEAKLTMQYKEQFQKRFTQRLKEGDAELKKELQKDYQEELQEEYALLEKAKKKYVEAKKELKEKQQKEYKEQRELLEQACALQEHIELEGAITKQMQQLKTDQSTKLKEVTNHAKQTTTKLKNLLNVEKERMKGTSEDVKEEEGGRDAGITASAPGTVAAALIPSGSSAPSNPGPPMPGAGSKLQNITMND